MNTDHSSLCAYTDLNVSELDKLGLISVDRLPTAVHREGKDIDDTTSGTALGPFDNGLMWFDDDDIKRNKDLLPATRFYARTQQWKR